jgi:hypothetical protein
MCDKSIHSHVTAANNTSNHNTQNDKAVHPLQATSAGPSLPKWACPLVLKMLQNANTRIRMSQRTELTVNTDSENRN